MLDTANIKFNGNKLDVICKAIKKLHNFVNGRKSTR